MRISYYETSWVQLWVTSFFQEVLLENELADSRKDSDPPLKTFPLKKEVELRFLHFKLVDFWGKGGGLQYFYVEPGKIVLRIQALFDQSSGFRESEKFFLDSDCPNLGFDRSNFETCKQLCHQKSGCTAFNWRNRSKPSSSSSSASSSESIFLEGAPH